MFYPLLKRVLELAFFSFILLAFNTTLALAADRHVASLADLQAAIKDSSVQTIYLDSDLDFPASAKSITPIARNITIDGQNHTITNEGTITAIYGLYFNANNMTINLKNLNFGNASTKQSFSNYWGLAYGSGNHQNLNLENVTYFSNYFAQPFWLPNATNTITFSGSNSFDQEPGLGTQEWAEAAHFVFKPHSTTSIKHNTTEAGGFIWSTSALNFQLEDAATVSVTTNHYFSWTDSINNQITLGKKANLQIKETNTAMGNFSQRNDTKFSIDVGEDSKLSLDLPKKSAFNGGIFSFGRGSVGSFHTGDTSFFNSSWKGPSFSLVNPKQITFSADTGSANNPIGLNDQTNLKFADFEQGMAGYGVFADDDQLDLQTAPDPWSINGTGITRANTDFSTDGKAKLATAKTIQLIRYENLTFDGNGGVPISQNKIAVAESTVSLKDLGLTPPKRKNYIFDGWSTKKDDVTTKVESLEVPLGGATLYALWVPNDAVIKKIDDFDFGSQIIRGDNTTSLLATATIEDTLLATSNNGWQLLVKYDSQDEETRKWLDVGFQLTLSPSSPQTFVLLENSVALNQQNQLVAQVADEAKKGPTVEETIALNPKFTAEKVQVGNYHAVIDWNIQIIPK